MSETFDSAARRHAVDPSQNVVLEASAGTGKTRVLVDRYVNLLAAGVEPEHILAITFTRKAATEMRERIIERVREKSRSPDRDSALWRELGGRLSSVAISTIDAFCLSLLREFPLEADVDPGFELADDTEAPRLIDESLDQALRICRSVANADDDVALVFAQLGERRLRVGLTTLLDRRLVAPQALGRYLAAGPRDLTASVACRTAASRFRDVLGGVPGGLRTFLDDGPIRRPQFEMLATDIGRLVGDPNAYPVDTRDGQAAFRALVDRLRAYFLTQEGRPRGEKFGGTGFGALDCRFEAAWKRHRIRAAAMAPAVAEVIRGFRRDLNVVLSRGVWRIFAVALVQYQRTLDARARLDFAGVLERAVRLLKDLDEFALSRFRLETRYRHVLVDEFQDTSRAQWELVAQLVRGWAAGFGAATDGLAPSIFVVGDRKQSIYAFRDAESALLDEAAAFIERLRTDGDPRRAITVSFRADSRILAFVNDLFDSVDKAPARPDAFRYSDDDRFPVGDAASELSTASPFCSSDADRRLETAKAEPVLGLVVGETVADAANRVASEICRLLGRATVRDRSTGTRRAAQPADIAILFRSRDSHREFEKALERRDVVTYVYKGLGFFDADEVQDVVALVRYLADPSSNLRAAAFLRSRLVRLSDVAIARLAPEIARSLTTALLPEAVSGFGDDDRTVFTRLREQLPAWLSWVDRLTPSALVSAVLAETAYGREIRGFRYAQARENLKKLRQMIRRFQNRGYATLGRVADYLDQLALGDESNAAIDARDAVSLMTVHAAKGLEFPIVFVVNMGRGTGTRRPPVRVSIGRDGEASVAIADYQSEADEDSAAREREETKRLLYVALTRARDRLYLSASVRQGIYRTTRGSLGEILPQTLKRTFVEAGQTGDRELRAGLVTWLSLNGRGHEFVVPRAF
jgi:ATP-dependent helicase/nuclease subunit A